MTLPRHIYLSNIANFPSVSRPNGYWVNWSVFVWCKVLRNLFLFEAYENHKWRGTLNLDKVRTVPWILNKHRFALSLKTASNIFNVTTRVCSFLKLILKDSIQISVCPVPRWLFKSSGGSTFCSFNNEPDFSLMSLYRQQ